MEFAKYLRIVSGRKHSRLLEEACAYVKNGSSALDLGAGALDDTRFLLSRGYVVDAVDSEPSFINFGKDLSANLIVSTFDNLDFPIGKYDLINARYALPFNPPETFDLMFTRLVISLRPNGVFVGQFFGPKDSWSDNKKMTFHTKEQIRPLLKGFTIVRLDETKKTGRTALGQRKYWHVFNVVAIRNEIGSTSRSRSSRRTRVPSLL